MSNVKKLKSNFRRVGRVTGKDAVAVVVGNNGGGAKSKSAKEVLLISGPGGNSSGGRSRSRSRGAVKVIRPARRSGQRRADPATFRVVQKNAQKFRSTAKGKTMNFETLFLDSFCEPESNPPPIPPLVFDGRVAPVNAPFLVKSPDVTQNVTGMRVAGATVLTDPNLFYFPLGQLVGVLRRDVRCAYILPGNPVAWLRNAYIAGANSAPAGLTYTASEGEWFPFVGMSSSQNPYQNALGLECARNDPTDGKPGIWCDTPVNNGGSSTLFTTMKISVPGITATYTFEYVCSRSGQETVNLVASIAVASVCTITLPQGGQGWYSLRLSDANAGALGNFGLQFSGSCSQLWHCPAPAVGVNLANIEGACAISGSLMVTNASPLEVRDGLALGWLVPTGDSFEELAFSSVQTTLIPPNDMFVVLSNKVGRIPEAAPSGARVMLPPPGRDSLVAENITSGSTTAAYIPYDASTEVDEVVLVFQFGPAGSLGSNDVMYFNGSIGWLFSTENPVIPTTFPIVLPSQWDDMSARGIQIVPIVTTNAFHVKEIYNKIKSGLGFVSEVAPLAAGIAAIIPGGQMFAPFLSGLGSAATVGKGITSAIDAISEGDVNGGLAKADAAAQSGAKWWQMMKDMPAPLVHTLPAPSRAGWDFNLYNEQDKLKRNWGNPNNPMEKWSGLDDPDRLRFLNPERYPG